MLIDPVPVEHERSKTDESLDFFINAEWTFSSMVDILGSEMQALQAMIQAAQALMYISYNDEIKVLHADMCAFSYMPRPNRLALSHLFNRLVS